MSKIHLFFPSLFVILAELLYLSHADVGTAAHYRPPYLRKCHKHNVAPKITSITVIQNFDENLFLGL